MWQHDRASRVSCRCRDVYFQPVESSDILSSFPMPYASVWMAFSRGFAARNSAEKLNFAGKRGNNGGRGSVPLLFGIADARRFTAIAVSRE